MGVIVGVHGIFQGRKTSEVLGQEWSRTLTVGLRQVVPGASSPQIVVPHLSPLLTAPRITLCPGDDLDDLDTLSAEETEFIESGLDDLLADLSEGEIDRLAEAAQTLAGLPAFPTRHGLRALAAVDGRWRGGGGAALRVLREVHAYLLRPEVGAQVRRRVRAAAHADTSLLLAHSLGSVVAYDLLRRGELPQVTALVTCGSPLAWPTIRRHLADSGTAGADVPLPQIKWTNVHDVRDAVTAGRPLGQVWPQVTDHQVTNPVTDAHGAAGYLRQEPLVRAVLAGAGPSPHPPQAHTPRSAQRSTPTGGAW
jgi:hypothetical protein